MNAPVSFPSRYVLSVAPIVIITVLVVLTGSCAFRSIPAGHVGVATLFGNIRPKPYTQGLHSFVNPLYRWTLYDCRQKTYQESAGVPSQDQLTTQIDVSVQYRLQGDMVPQILGETGTAGQTLTVHLVPKLRSLLREQGKSIIRAEDFFLEETQQRLQDSLFEGLHRFLAPKGIAVEAVLLRDIQLPQFITAAIEQKKEREQAVERQKAELERFRLEQQQIVAEAEAQKDAAEQEADRRRMIADAQSYEIEKINKAIANNQSYIQLEALKALQAISKDPAAKIYFLNSNSPMPLPLMHIGDPTPLTPPQR